MTERDAVFRDKLIALMTALNGAEGRSPALRRALGSFAHRIAKEAGAKSWADLKRRADGPTYDSLLALLQRQGADFAKARDTNSLRALEALGLSLVARTQSQGDLVPGVGFLDRLIEDCESAYRRSGKVVATTVAPRAPRPVRR
ncbi:MAG: hypothetical protein ACO1OG_12640 [Devosia sp.]